jgi:uncharacterized membrane protein YoaK (UPF0700 family)
VSAEKPVPRIVPALLSFAAGYVDACTFLALFGLYVAQVTGSFVVLGAGLVTRDEGFLIKVLAIPVFFAAGLFTTVLAEILRRHGRSALMWTLALEGALLAGLMALGTPARFSNDPNAPLTLLAAMFGLSAMGVQSAAVRLLLPRVASTNVMTTNTTLFAINTGELLLGWHGRRNGDTHAAAQYDTAREHLAALVPLGLGFLFGTGAGALGYMWFGLWCLVLILAELAALAAWAARRS